MMYRSLQLSISLLLSLLSFNALAIAITDVTFRVGDAAYTNADFASSLHSGNDNTASVNTLGGAFAGDPWVRLDKTDDSGTVFNDLLFSVTTDSEGAQTGAWELQWSGAGLPAFLDLVLVTKAATSWGAYLFDDIFLSANSGSGDGTFDITWLNKGGKVPGLSHISLYGRLGEGGGSELPPEEIPVPGSILLLGLGLGILYRSKRGRS